MVTQFDLIMVDDTQLIFCGSTISQVYFALHNALATKSSNFRNMKIRSSEAAAEVRMNRC